jgi:biotin carboxyl carrier protein
VRNLTLCLKFLRRINMKKFLIKVNGNQYEVEVEEIKDSVVTSSPAVTVSNPTPAPAPAPTPAPKAAVPKKSAGGSAGSVKVEAPMPGTILAVNVKPGDSVKKGQVLVILEAMKMENEILAPQDGTVASVDTSSGASVDSGDLLITLN